MCLCTKYTGFFSQHIYSSRATLKSSRRDLWVSVNLVLPVVRCLRGNSLHYRANPKLATGNWLRHRRRSTITLELARYARLGRRRQNQGTPCCSEQTKDRHEETDNWDTIGSFQLHRNPWETRASACAPLPRGHHQPEAVYFRWSRWMEPRNNSKFFSSAESAKRKKKGSRGERLCLNTTRCWRAFFFFKSLAHVQGTPAMIDGFGLLQTLMGGKEEEKKLGAGRKS